MWLSEYVKRKKPKIVVEMGGERGEGSVALLKNLSPDGLLFSIDISPKWDLPGADDKRLIKIEGDDTNPNIYPSDFPWDSVDLWFIDSDHRSGHVAKQIELIKPYLKKGDVLAFHDIYLEGNFKVDPVLGGGNSNILKNESWDFWEDNQKVFYHGFGIAVM
jgi:predicted O-methyltransferase YrrM